MNILVINSGSSSIKYEYFDLEKHQALASGILERIGETNACLTHRHQDAQGHVQNTRSEQPLPDHRAGLEWIGSMLKESGLTHGSNDLHGIGHRVVHGGELFKEPTLINEEVIAAILTQSPLAPLHNPANLTGIEEACRFAPHVPQVAVFDTAFHQTIPAVAYQYAIPRDLYQKYHVRRYGFHGTSHRYVTQQAAHHLEKPLDQVNLIVFHLGNGASVAAIRDGQSVDTSMGMTPLEGLIMGTRCGDIDPSIIFYLGRVTGQSPQEIEAKLNKESGLKGICGASDMREVVRRMEADDEQARLAHDMVAYRIKKYLGAYYAVLGRVDAVVFTGGIGENVHSIRAKVCEDLESLGIELDPHKNIQRTKGIQEIHKNGSLTKLLVIPTNEELQIAQLTAACIKDHRPT
ncbi:MAG: acetate kinase [Verrucomicrobia bacterium]|nr:acetate kinase [Verrucomicrobiota bacterium]